MEKKKYVYWKDDEVWLGYLDEYPDYMTQGQSIEELKDNLRDILKDLEGGKIPSARRIGELEVT